MNNVILGNIVINMYVYNLLVGSQFTYSIEEKKTIHSMTSTSARKTKDISYLRFIDLRDTYNESEETRELLVQFYNDIMKKYFPIEDELDPLDVWESGLSSEHPLLPELHVCIALDTRKNENNNGYRIAGGSMFEYYKMSNLTLLSYFVVTDDYQNLGLGRVFVEQAYHISKQIAHKHKEKNHRTTTVTNILNRVNEQLKLAEEEKGFVIDKELQEEYKFVCEYLRIVLNDPIPDEFFTFVAETNAVGVSDGVMESEGRHGIMNRIGFKLLDFEYIQPPLSEDQNPCADLLLLILHVNELPFDKERDKNYIPTCQMKCFMLEFLFSVFQHIEGKNDDYYNHVLQDLDTRGKRLYIDIKTEIPWLRRTSWKPKQVQGNYEHRDASLIINPRRENLKFHSLPSKL
jgi:GNAT superfamily N-acetyltransferase